MNRLITILSCVTMVVCLTGVVGTTAITFNVPESGAMVLLSSGLLVIAIYYKRKINKEPVDS